MKNLCLFFLTLTAAFPITPGDKAIDLRLDRGTFRKGDFSLFKQNAVICDGKIEGMIYIKEAKKFVFYPHQTLVPGTHYICKFKIPLEIPGEFQLSIDPITILKVKRIKLEDDSTGISLQLNSAVSPREIPHILKLLTRQNLSEHPLEYQLFPKIPSTSFLMKILDSFDAETELKLVYEPSNLPGFQPEGRSWHLKASAKDDVPFISDDKLGDLIFLEDPEVVTADEGKFKIKVYLPERMSANGNTGRIRIKPDLPFELGASQYNPGRWQKNHRSRYFTELSADFQPDSEISLEFLPGLKTKTLETKSKTVFQLKIPSRKPFLKFERQLQYTSSLDRPINFRWCNLKNITLVIHRLPVKNEPFFFQFSEKGLHQFLRLSPILTQRELELQKPDNEIHQSTIKLSTLGINTAESGVLGLRFFHEVEGTKHLLDEKIVIPSSYGIHAELGRAQFKVFIHDLDSSDLRAEVPIQIYDRYSRILFDGKTNNRGELSMDWDESRRPGLIIAGDTARRSYLSLSSEYLKTRYVKEKSFFRVTGFLERKLFRPGEDIPGAFNIRSEDFTPVRSMPVRIRLVDPAGKEVLSRHSMTNSMGILPIRILSDYTWKTGPYRIYARFAGHERLLERFSLESFLPPRIKVHAEVINPLIGRDSVLRIKGNAAFLFGAPASKMPILIQVNGRPRDAVHKNLDGFVMGVELEEAHSQLIPLATLKTFCDQDGDFEISVRLKNSPGLPQHLEGQVEVQALDEGREVNHYLKFQYYPAGQFIGIRPLFSGTIQRSQKHDFEVKFLNIPSESEVLSPFLAQFYRKIWKWSFDQAQNQSRYRQELQLVKSQTISEGSQFTTVLEGAGSYVLIVTELSSGAKGSHHYYVSGYGDQELRPGDSLKAIKLLTKEDSIQPGETLSIQVQSPVTGILHCTLYDHQIYSSRSIPLNSLTTSISLSIPQTLEPAVDHLNIRAQVSRALSGANPQRFPIEASGIKTLFYDRSDRGQVLELNDPLSLRSRGMQKITLSGVTDPATQIYASIVDTGIHALIRDRFQPLENLLRAPIPSSLQAYHFYDQLDDPSLDYPMLRFGGDAADMQQKARQKNLPPDSLNERVKPQAHFLGPLQADKSGSVSLGFQPDGFQGEVEVRVGAIGKDSVSSVSKTFKIKDQATLSGSFPRYLYEGDEFLVHLRAFTTEKWKSGLKLGQYFSDHLNIENLPERLFENGKESEHLQLRLKAIRRGSGYLKLRLLDGSTEVTSLEIHLPVQELLVQNEFFLQEQVSGVWIPELPKAYRRLKEKKLDLHIDTDPYRILKPHLQDLINYPYGCAEQISSRLLALRFISRLKGTQDWPEDKGKLEGLLSGGIAKLRALHQSNQGYRLFPGGNIHAQLSLYVIEVLQNLNEIQGVKDLLKGSQNTLLKIMNNPKSDTLSRFHAAYLLAARDHLRISDWNQLLKEEKDNTSKLIKALTASTYSLLGQKEKARTLFNQLGQFQHKDHSAMFSSRLRSESWVDYLGVRHGDFPKNKVRERAFQDFRNRRYLSTQEKAQLIRTLVSAQPKSTPGPLRAELKILQDPKILIEDTHEYSSDLISFAKSPIHLEVRQGLAQISLSIIGKGEVPIYEKNNGFGLSQEILNAKSDSLVVGSEITLRQKIQSAKRDNLVLKFMLPACMEAINPRLKGQSLATRNVNMEYADFRDDRVLLFFHTKANGWIDLPMQIIQSGKCQIPFSSLQAMYQPSLQDYTRIAPSLNIPGSIE